MMAFFRIIEKYVNNVLHQLRIEIKSKAGHGLFTKRSVLEDGRLLCTQTNYISIFNCERGEGTGTELSRHSNSTPTSFLLPEITR